MSALNANEVPTGPQYTRPQAIIKCSFMMTMIRSTCCRWLQPSSVSGRQGWVLSRCTAVTQMGPFTHFVYMRIEITEYLSLFTASTNNIAD